MHVIGFAEPEGSSNDSREVQSVKRYLAYEMRTGEQMDSLGQLLMEVGLWGYTGLRYRLLTQRPLSLIPFWQMPRHIVETVPQPVPGMLLAGLPTDLLSRQIQWGYVKALNSYLWDWPIPWSMLVLLLTRSLISITLTRLSQS